MWNDAWVSVYCSLWILYNIVLGKIASLDLCFLIYKILAIIEIMDYICILYSVNTDLKTTQT